MEELWKQIPKFPDYEASNQGNIRRTDSGRFLSYYQDERGHRSVTIRKDGKTYSAKISNLVAEAFIGKKPKGKNVYHINKDRSDNRVENLMYDTRSNQSSGSKSPSSKFSDEEVINIREKVKSLVLNNDVSPEQAYQVVSLEKNVHKETIKKMCTGVHYKKLSGPLIKDYYIKKAEKIDLRKMKRLRESKGLTYQELGKMFEIDASYAYRLLKNQ